MKVPVPRELTEEIAHNATRLAREAVQRRGWSPQSASSFLPVFEEGLIGVRTPIKHLHYQNAGTKPFVMWWAEGRVIPLPSGPILATGVGQPGWGYQDRKDKKAFPHTGKIWRQQRWRHPGLQDQRFMEHSLRGAIRAAKPELQKRTMEILAGRAKDEDLR